MRQSPNIHRIFSIGCILFLGIVSWVGVYDSLAWAVEVPLSAATVEGRGVSWPAKYVPPLISNGSLSLQIDGTGGQRQAKYAGIWRAGRRYGSPKADLVPFGWFEQSLRFSSVSTPESASSSVDVTSASETNSPSSSEYPPEWTQTLDVRRGLMTTVGRWNELTQTMECFTPLDQDVLVMRRSVTSHAAIPLHVQLQLTYHFCPPGKTDQLPDRVILPTSYPSNDNAWTIQPEQNAICLRNHIFGHPVSQGEILLFTDLSTKASDPSDFQMTYQIDALTATLTIEGTLAPGETKPVTFFILLEDSIDGPEFSTRAVERMKFIRKTGAETLLNRNIQAWTDYLAESLVDIPDAAVQRMLNTAQYHLRVNATRWSFPVGIAPALWNGRYFGWDEMFCHQGLITSNHLTIARRCPEFRKAILPVATSRVAHYGKPGRYGARYVWEALEDGSEGAPQGFWYDHIFHMSNIARSAWTQYLYSGDLEYLQSTGYPIILECARYFRSHWVYEDSNGEMYIGKCTDLERLGPAKDHPFMTTCGAIYTLRAAVDAAQRLGKDADEMTDFRQVADRLVASLPHRDGAYIGYPNCTEPTIATLGGIFPYDIFDGSNALQKNAAYRFMREGRANGNMYPVGNAVCPWYAGKLAATFAVLEDRDAPIQFMRDAALTTGYFGEIYEINEATVSINPWFTTAAGNCVYAVNQMLIHCSDDEIRLFSGVPDTWTDFRFRLPAYDGILVDAEVRDGRLTRLTLHSQSNQSSEKTIILRKKWLDGVPLNPAVVVREIKENPDCGTDTDCEHEMNGREHEEGISDVKISMTVSVDGEISLLHRSE